MVVIAIFYWICSDFCQRFDLRYIAVLFWSALYVSNKYKKYCKILPQMSFYEINCEILTVSLSKPTMRRMIISCVYPPPSGKNNVCIEYLKLFDESSLNLEFEFGL